MLKQIVFIVLVFVFVLLQIQLWGKEGSRTALDQQNQQELELHEKIATHETQIQSLEESTLHLHKNPDATEERARHDFGMIKADETLIFLPENESE